MRAFKVVPRSSLIATGVRFAASAATGGSTETSENTYNDGKFLTKNRPRTWPWGSDELNQLSFADAAEKFNERTKSGAYPPVHEFGGFAPAWSVKDVANVRVTHKPPQGIADHIAYRAVKLCRWGFDTFSLYRFGKVTENKVVNRCLFLETIAAIPGMVGGMLRHMSALRRMEHDHGWIQTLLEEAENERMHLMTFIDIREPGVFFHFCILAAQGIMFNVLFFLYLVSPRFVHRFVGYLEEEAVITYTSFVEMLRDGSLKIDDSRVPQEAKNYWGLRQNATFLELIDMIRADEAEHRVVNHTFADMHLRGLNRAANPFTLIDLKTIPPSGTA